MTPMDSGIEKYHRDIETIKSLLMKVEEKPIFESWVFFIGGLLILAGTFIYYFAVQYNYLSIAGGLARIWLPLYIFSTIPELISLARKMSSESLPLFSRTIIKLYASITGASIGGVFIIIMILKAGAVSIIPATILASWGILYFYYAQTAYTSFYTHGYVLIFLSIFLYSSGLPVPVQLLIAGIIISMSVFTAGIIEWRKEKNCNAE